MQFCTINFRVLLGLTETSVTAFCANFVCRNLFVNTYKTTPDKQQTLVKMTSGELVCLKKIKTHSIVIRADGTSGLTGYRGPTFDNPPPALEANCSNTTWIRKFTAATNHCRAKVYY